MKPILTPDIDLSILLIYKKTKTQNSVIFTFLVIFEVACWWPCHQQATSSVHYTTSCKHNLVPLRMGEIIARNMLSWLKLLINCYCFAYLVVYTIIKSELPTRPSTYFVFDKFGSLVFRLSRNCLWKRKQMLEHTTHEFTAIPRTVLRGGGGVDKGGHVIETPSH